MKPRAARKAIWPSHRSMAEVIFCEWAETVFASGGSLPGHVMARYNRLSEKGRSINPPAQPQEPSAA